MYIDANMIITAGSVLAAITAIGGFLIAVYKWFERQNKQDRDIAKMKDGSFGVVGYYNNGIYLGILQR